MNRAGEPEHARREPRRATIWTCLAGATALAIALRWPFLGNQSLGYEEAYTASIVAHPSVGGVWRAVEATESTPPLSYLLDWAWVKLAGIQADAVLRVPAMLAGIAAAPCAFFALRRFTGPRAALGAAWLCAGGPVLVGFSLYARSYSLLVLLSVLSLWAFGAVLERPTRRRWLLWALAAAACVWTHYFGAFLLLGEAVVLLAQLPRARVATLAWSGLVAAAAGPLVPVFAAQSAEGARTDYIALTSLTTRLGDVVRQFPMGANVPSGGLEAAGILIALAGVGVGALTAWRRRDAGPATLAAVAIVAVGVPVGLAVLGIDDHLLMRNVLAGWICVAGVAAVGLTRGRGAPLVAFLAIGVATVAWIQSDWRYQAADWRGAAARVAARATGDPVAVLPGLQVVVAARYLRGPVLATPVGTSEVWAMIEPRRTGRRELEPTPGGIPPGLVDPRFRVVSERRYRGFRLVALTAAPPGAVNPRPAENGPAGAPRALVLAP